MEYYLESLAVAALMVLGSQSNAADDSPVGYVTPPQPKVVQQKVEEKPKGMDEVDEFCDAVTELVHRYWGFKDEERQAKVSGVIDMRTRRYLVESSERYYERVVSVLKNLSPEADKLIHTGTTCADEKPIEDMPKAILWLHPELKKGKSK